MDVKINGPYKVKNRELFRAKISAGDKECYVFGKTKYSCIEKAIEKQKALRSHIICDGVTVEEFASIWLDQRCTNLSPTSLAEWKRLISGWIIPELGKVKIDELRCADCQRLITLYNKTHSSKSCSALRGVLHNMLEYARMNELIVSNPCEHILIMKTPQYEYYIYSAEEMRRLLDAVRDQPDYELPITLASFCGLRASEIFGLRWEDIDFDSRTITVRQVAIYANGQKIIKNVPKTATSSKPIMIPPSVVAVLNKYKTEAIHPLVICYPDGSPFVSSNYHQRFDTLLRTLGLPKTRFHDLRHFVATSLMDAGLPDKVISEYLRHSDTNITKKYEHIRSAQRSTASDAMESILA